MKREFKQENAEHRNFSEKNDFGEMVKVCIMTH